MFTFVMNALQPAVALLNGETESSDEKSKITHLDDFPLPTPAQLVAQLDEHVNWSRTGQKALAVAVYNHYKRLRHPQDATNIELANLIFAHWADRLWQNTIGTIVGA